MSKKFICLVSFVLVLGLVLPSVAQAGLVGWWRFEEGSGDTATMTVPAMVTMGRCLEPRNGCSVRKASAAHLHSTQTDA